MSTTDRRTTDPSPSLRARTRLQRFMDKHAVTAVRLETEIEMSHPGLTRIRAGGGVRLTTMRRILYGLRKVTGRPVSMEEIFDLDPDGKREEGE